MPFQTLNVRFRIFSQSKNELAVRKPLVQLPINRKPRPVFKRFEPFCFLKHRFQLISLNLHGEIHVERAMLEAESPETISERCGSGFWQTDSDHFGRFHWTKFNPGGPNPVSDLLCDHAPLLFRRLRTSS